MAERYRDERVPELLLEVPVCPLPGVPWLPVVVSVPLPLVDPAPEPVPLLPVPLPLMDPVPEPVSPVMLPLPGLPVPLVDPVPESEPLRPMSPVVPVRPVLPVVPLPLVEPMLLPEPELLPAPDPLPCAKTNVAVMQSTAKARVSIFVDVRFIIVSFESFLVMAMVPRRVTSLAFRCQGNGWGTGSLSQQFACHRGEGKPRSVRGHV
jgi:hypothetical protein